MGWYNGEIIGEMEVPEVTPKKKTLFVILDGDSQILFLHGGKTQKEGASFHDGYGKDTGLKAAIKESKGLMEYYSITSESSLEIIVKHFLYRKVMEKITPEPEYGEKYRRADGYNSQIVQITPIVWSSKNPDTEGVTNTPITCPICNSINGCIDSFYDAQSQSWPGRWSCQKCGYISPCFDSHEDVIDYMNNHSQEDTV